MPTSFPTSNTSPDPGQGGSAVTSPTNTGHASTSSVAIGDDIGVVQDKTCIWQSFSAVSGQVLSATLKITHTSTGLVSGASASNQFVLEYSLNGGGSWSTVVSRVNMASSQGPTVFSVALSPSQNLSQVRVRDFIRATAVTSGDTATATVTISDIQIEVLVSQERGVMISG